MAQPLRRQIFIVLVLLTVVVYAAIFYGARLTYDEHVRQLAAQTSTMAATVVVYVNRNLETADAVADTASRHPSLRQLDHRAASEVLLPLVGGPDALLNNALMADANGTPLAWARPPNPEVEGAIDATWLAQVARTGKVLVSPMLGKAGDPVHAIVLAYPIVSEKNELVGVLGLSVHLEALEKVLASIPLPAGSVVTLTDAQSVVVARSLESSQYVGRSAAPAGAARNPYDVPASVILTGVDGVERVFGNAVVERGPWLASVGIPTSVAWARTMPIYQRNFCDRLRVDRLLHPPGLDIRPSLVEGVRSSRYHRDARQPGGSVAARTAADADRRDGSPAADREQHDHQLAERALRDCGANRR